MLSDVAVDFGSVSGVEPAPDVPDAPPPALFSNTVGGRPYPPQLFDHGTVYASKSFRTSNGRRVWWGWAYETAAGCEQLCGTGTPFTDALVRARGTHLLARGLRSLRVSRGQRGGVCLCGDQLCEQRTATGTGEPCLSISKNK